MKQKKIPTIIILCVLVLVLLFILIVANQQRKEELNQVSNYFKDKTSIAASGDLVSKQKDADEKILEAMNDRSCTFDNPCVLVNPYGIDRKSVV